MHVHRGNRADRDDLLSTVVGAPRLITRGWSQRQMALRLYRAADERVQAGLPRIEHIVRRIVSYESGSHRPRDPYVELYSRAFGSGSRAVTWATFMVPQTRCSWSGHVLAR
jgi:hypothetical protein